MGLAPTLLPGRVSESSAHETLEAEWGPLPEGLGRNATSILEGLRDGDLRALVMLGTDPIRDHVEPDLAESSIKNADFVVALRARCTSLRLPHASRMSLISPSFW